MTQSSMRGSKIAQMSQADDLVKTRFLEYTGREDDFQALDGRVLQADVLVLVTPVYWREVSESAKVFTESPDSGELGGGAIEGDRG